MVCQSTSEHGYCFRVGFSGLDGDSGMCLGGCRTHLAFVMMQHGPIVVILNMVLNRVCAWQISESQRPVICGWSRAASVAVCEVAVRGVATTSRKGATVLGLRERISSSSAPMALFVVEAREGSRGGVPTWAMGVVECMYSGSISEFMVGDMPILAAAPWWRHSLHSAQPSWPQVIGILGVGGSGTGAKHLPEWVPAGSFCGGTCVMSLQPVCLFLTVHSPTH